MTINQVRTKINSILTSENCLPDDQQFTALLYSFVTHLDLDGLTKTVSNRWLVFTNI